MSLDAEVSWALQQAKVELDIVRLLVQESMARLDVPITLPASTANSEAVKGVLKRTGENVVVRIDIKTARLGCNIKNEHLTLPQVDIATRHMVQADLALGLLDTPVSVDISLQRFDEVKSSVEGALRALKTAPEFLKFPGKMTTWGCLPQGVCVNAYILDYEVKLELHSYQDSKSGHTSVDNIVVPCPDPSLIAVGTKLEAAHHRMLHIINKLGALALVVKSQQLGA